MEDSSIIKISHSSVKTFEQCKAKYKYQYLDHIQRKTWSHLILGNLAHRTLEIFHKSYIEKRIAKTKLNKLMAESFASAQKEFSTTKEMLSEAYVLLNDYLSTIIQNGMPNVIGTEVPFDIQLDDKITVRGYIDRIDKIGDRFKIIDYKTTKNVKYLEPFQLSIYGLWLKKEHPEIEAFDAAYVLLRHKSKEKSYSFNLKDLGATNKKLVSYASQIQDEQTWGMNPGPLCKFCDFQSICPSQNKPAW